MAIIYDPKDARYLDEADVRSELTRVFDICDGCRRCVDLCTVFPTLSKPGRAPAGPSLLAEGAAASGVPVLAVGGISPDNLGEVAAAGAAGFAAIGLFAVASEAAMASSVAAATAAFTAV